MTDLHAIGRRAERVLRSTSATSDEHDLARDVEALLALLDKGEVVSAGKYRKKPVEVEAIQWSGSNWHQMLAWITWEGSRPIHTVGEDLVVETLEGALTARPGDWIIRGIQDELYPCKPDIFDATYEPVGEPT